MSSCFVLLLSCRISNGINHMMLQTRPFPGVDFLPSADVRGAFLGRALAPCRVPASRSRPSPPARQGDGSAGLARAACLVVSPAHWSRDRRVAHGVADVVVRAMGPSPVWAETGPLALGERQSRARARGRSSRAALSLCARAVGPGRGPLRAAGRPEDRDGAASRCSRRACGAPAGTSAATAGAAPRRTRLTLLLAY